MKIKSQEGFLKKDITNDFQSCYLHSLQDSKDKEGDINGKVERLSKVANDWTYKTTKKANEKLP